MPGGKPGIILLDTHVFLWSIFEPEKLSKPARGLIESSNTRIYLSVASVWEISLKTNKRKLTAPDSVIDAQIASLGIAPLSIALPHVRALSGLKFVEEHKDPFDRLIAAQAVGEGFPLVTADEAFRRYPQLTVIW
jgi:PIN domain nuclease of toxin-antitoxin system